MKNAIKRGITGLLLVFGITSMTGCFYYHHETDRAYTEPDWRHRDYSYYRYDRDWHGDYAYGPHHHDWDYD